MLLTIHNLPASTGYSDVKALIQANCGLTQIILDNLVNEGRTKKVTIGLAEEGDAAILVRKINGLYYEGQQLYVEDIRQKKASEQPYRASKQDEYINVGGYPPQIQQGFPAMNMTPQFNYQFPYQGNGQPQQGNQYQEGIMPLMMQNPMMGQYMGYYMPQMQNSYMDQAKKAQATTDASQYSTYTNQQKFGQTSETNENRNRDASPRKKEKPLEKKHYITSCPVDQMAESYEYVRQGERQGGSSRWDNDKSTNYDNSYRSRSPLRNEGQYDNRQDDNLYDPYHNEETNDYSRPYYQQQRESSRNTSREIIRDSGSGAPEPYRPPETQTRQGSRANERSNQRNNSSNNDYYRKEPQAWSRQQSNDKFRPQNNRDYRNVAQPEQNWDDRRKPVENIPQDFGKSWKIKGNQSRATPKHPQNTWENRKLESSSKPQPQKSWNKGETNPVPYKSQPQNSWAKRNPAPVPSYSKPQKPWDNKQQATEKQKRGEVRKMINQDTSWRLQAAALIGKEIWSNRTIPDHLNPQYVLKQIKAAVHSRIEMLLQEEIGVLQDDIVKRYRKKFPNSDDKNFGEAVIKKILDDPELPPRAFNKEIKFSDLSVMEEAAGSNQTKEKPKQAAAAASKPARKPVPPPSAPSQLPKYPLGDKKTYTAQKQLQKLEYAGEDLYPLDPVTSEVLEKEVQDLCALYEGELNDPDATEQETIVRERMRQEGLEDFKRVIKLNVTKRLLNIRTHLTVRVYAQGKTPKLAELRECLAKLGVISLKKSDTKKSFYIANCDTYEDYDNLCRMENMAMSEITALKFKALHLTGPPKKVRKAQIEANRQKFIDSQISDFPSKANEDFQFTGNDELYKSEDIMENIENEKDMEGGEEMEQGGEQMDPDQVNEEDYEDY